MGESSNSARTPVDSFALVTFVVLFFLIYFGVMLLSFLPEPVLGTTVVVYSRNSYVLVKRENSIGLVEQRGVVAAATTVQQVPQKSDQGILALLLKIPENFIKSLLASLTL